MRNTVAKTEKHGSGRAFMTQDCALKIAVDFEDQIFLFFKINLILLKRGAKTAKSAYCKAEGGKNR